MGIQALLRVPHLFVIASCYSTVIRRKQHSPVESEKVTNMEMPRLSRSVVKAVRLETDRSGSYTPIVIYKRPQSKKKKGSPGLRVLDRTLRRSINAQKAFLDSYMSAHGQSNTKKKDGWIIDLAPNLMTAGRNGVKKLRLNRLPL